MDFIKTSSLRALIELTFQRNWNGLIWMSRKGVTTKRVKTVQTALSRISAQPRSPAGRGTNVPLGQITSVREVSAKVTHHDPGNIARGRPSTTVTPRRARPAREPGTTSRPRNPRVPRPMHPSEPGNVPSGRETIGQIFIRRPRRPTVNPSGHDRSDSATTRCPADRPDRPSQRRGRPEARFEAHFIFSSPA
ncbi:unnamed protein product [Microthlaspi erraticum]|uniref:Uncharacterized protein n=1 Tax=Microthlaspi erraticum TaxID=1685480 RepID=A0A6D2JIE9_9BRAS|nr:unnamed protein product [Microthlaspi erraticum]